MIKRLLLIAAALFVGSSDGNLHSADVSTSGSGKSPHVNDRSPVDYVNPFIGAGSLEGIFSGFHGKNYPGAATPNGMVQLSPDTFLCPDKEAWGSWASY